MYEKNRKYVEKIANVLTFNRDPEYKIKGFAEGLNAPIIKKL